MKISGGCHCGAVRFEAQCPDNQEMLECNCSICSMTGYLHLFVKHADFALLSGEKNLTSYRFGSEQAEHIFCSTCGIKSFYQPRSHAESWSVNYNCLDDGHGLQVRVRKFDGQNWDKAKTGL